ncbi:MAG: hypothetical protein HOJ90_07115 [Alphaproteobacteria bacterium]|nr:hypothetical protein [Alphaproteobacteria bacterium]
MIRPTSSILLILAAVAGGVLFHISFEVSELDDRLGTLNHDIRSDREAIHVLRAEWSFLNQPDRLEELARRHLDLQPVSGTQLTGVGTLPVRPEEALPEITPHDDPTGLGRAIELHAGAPRVKPTAPARPTAIPVASAPVQRADVSRSLDDVLREIVNTGPSSAKAGAQ